VGEYWLHVGDDQSRGVEVYAIIDVEGSLLGNQAAKEKAFINNDLGTVLTCRRFGIGLSASHRVFGRRKIMIIL
jgi:hypothetical protein